ncbi:hypothetical protein NL676_013154 [Syzygium grande]|nr:hypothetical protein NL676_013154 [Syzygium grande]
MCRLLYKSAVAACRRLGHGCLMSMGITMIGVGMATAKGYHGGTKSLLLPCFATLIASTLSLANADHIPLYMRYDIMKFQEKREMRMGLGEKKWIVVGTGGAALENSPIARPCQSASSMGGLVYALLWAKSEFLKYMVLTLQLRKSQLVMVTV